MSHVATIDLEVKDFAALEQAAAALGGKLTRGQTTYKWWGRHMGDYPVPAGFTPDDLGKCEHAISFPNVKYEVGVVKRRDGRPGWQLLWDFVDRSLVDVVGREGAKLKQEYALAVTVKQAAAAGFTVNKSTRADGSLVLRLTK